MCLSNCSDSFVLPRSVPQGPTRADPLAIAVADALQVTPPITYAVLATAIHARRCEDVETLMATLGLDCARLLPVSGVEIRVSSLVH